MASICFINRILPVSPRQTASLLLESHCCVTMVINWHTLLRLYHNQRKKTCLWLQNFGGCFSFSVEKITVNSECVEWVYGHSANLMQWHAACLSLTIFTSLSDPSWLQSMTSNYYGLLMILMIITLTPPICKKSGKKIQRTYISNISY